MASRPDKHPGGRGKPCRFCPGSGACLRACSALQYLPMPHPMPSGMLLAWTHLQGVAGIHARHGYKCKAWPAYMKGTPSGLLLCCMNCTHSPIPQFALAASQPCPTGSASLALSVLPTATDQWQMDKNLYYSPVSCNSSMHPHHFPATLRAGMLLYFKPMQKEHALESVADRDRRQDAEVRGAGG